jgi:hypothetical protein
MRLIEIVALFLFPLWTFGVHALLMRVPRIRKLPHQMSAVLIALLTGFVLSVIILRGNFSFERLFFSLFCCLGLAHVYFHIFNMSETARRIRILVGLESGISPSLGEDYNPEEAIKVRMARLTAIDQVAEEKPGFYAAKPSILLYVSLFLKGYEDFLFSKRKAPGPSQVR